MVELRKRKEAPPAPEKPAKKKAAPKAQKETSALDTTLQQAGEAVTAAVEKVEETIAGMTGATNGPKTGPKVGDTIALEGFAGDVETQDGKTVTLKQLVDESEKGVIIFTYPKASTPGCTTQACAFRDGYSILTATGFAIYGLSSDGPKANTTFKTKHNLPYPLLCDPKHKLISAIGLSTAGKTKRGVFIVDKQGKVLEAFQGGPQPTVDAAQRIVSSAGKGAEHTKNGEDKKAADTAAEVADSAAKIDA